MEGFFGQSDSADGGGVFGVFGEGSGVCGEEEWEDSKNDGLRYSSFGEGRPDVVARLCMVVDWCIDYPEYTAKIKVIPKKDYPILMSCEF